MCSGISIGARNASPNRREHARPISASPLSSSRPGMMSMIPPRCASSFRICRELRGPPAPMGPRQPHAFSKPTGLPSALRPNSPTRECEGVRARLDPSRGRGRYAQQAPRRQKIGHLPITAYALDHPAQDRPKVAIDKFVVERLQLREQRMNLHPVRKRLAAAADEDERIGETGRGAHVPRLGQTAAAEVERAAEEVAKLRIMPDPILHQDQGPAFAEKLGLFADFDPAHGSSRAWRCRNSTMSAAI